jgi:predicted component of type VI protein secretion system
MPEPRPLVVSMTTTDGMTLPTTPTKSFCKAPAMAGDAGAEADGAALAAGSPDAGAPDESAPVPHAANRRDPPSRSVRRRGGALLLGIAELASDERDVCFISVPPLIRWVRFYCR